MYYFHDFDPDSAVDWVEFFDSSSKQEGSNGFRAGSIYQRGSGTLAQLLGKLFLSTVPLLKRAGSAIGREALSSSAQIAKDVIEGQNFRQSLKANSTLGYNNLLEKAVNKLQQIGKGRRKRRKASKPKVRKKRVAKKRKTKQRTKTKHITKTRDIFGKWSS